MNDDKKPVVNTDDDFDKGLERGKEGQGVSDPLIDLRSDEQKEGEKRGNEAGKIINAAKDSKKDEDDN